jgi:hypothetical protein
VTVRALVLLVALCALPAQAQSLSDAFNQGATLGRSGNSTARGKITGGTAQSTVPHYTANPPQASYFGSPGLGTPASARIDACAGGPGAAGGFNQTTRWTAVQSDAAPDLQHRTDRPAADAQSNHHRRSAGDRRKHRRHLQWLHWQTVTQPDIFETAICHGTGR